MKTFTCGIIGCIFMCSGMINAYANFDQNANHAIGKTAYASSGDALAAIYDNPGTRWESEFFDDQWWYVDLETPLNLSKIEILWEGAYGKHIKIQTALKNDENSDEILWEDAIELNRTITDLSTPEEIIITSPARYIRMQGVERALPYGYSFYELRVFARSEYINVEETILSSLVIENINVIKDETAPVYVNAYNQVGSKYDDVSIQLFTDTPDGIRVIEEDGIFFIEGLKEGEYILSAVATDNKSGDKVSAQSVVTVSEGRKVSGIIITSEREIGIVGEGIPLDITCTDQYGDTITPDHFDWIASSGTIENNIYYPVSKGTAEIKAFVLSTESNSLLINTVASGSNIALDKYITASSNMETASFITDGDNGTRWISPQPGETQEYEAFITIDLGADYNVDLIHLFWEGACPADYQIFYSTDNLNFSDAQYIVTDMPGMASIHKYHTGANTVTRYIMIKSTRAATIYGVSMWEMRVYGSSVITGMQSVNIDDENKNTGVFDITGRYYNLNGSDMESLPSGIYIINGKKIFKER